VDRAPIAVPSRFVDWRERRDPAWAATLDAIARGTVAQRAIVAARSGSGGSHSGMSHVDGRAPESVGRTIEDDLASAMSRLVDEGSARGGRSG
jgi:hypothetical protein